jgi:ribosomal protein S27AE
MTTYDFDAQWQGQMDEVLSGMREWRTAHPRATFAEIELAVDERLNRLRARMLEDAARSSRLANLEQVVGEERPRCRHCGTPLQARGSGERTLLVQGDQQVRLERSYAACPACGTGLFPPG